MIHLISSLSAHFITTLNLLKSFFCKGMTILVRMHKFNHLFVEFLPVWSFHAIEVVCKLLQRGVY